MFGIQSKIANIFEAVQQTNWALNGCMIYMGSIIQRWSNHVIHTEHRIDNLCHKQIHKSNEPFVLTMILGQYLGLLNQVSVKKYANNQS